jgi:predicted TIM-barrel fold metal-dependent hydrolase
MDAKVESARSTKELKVIDCDVHPYLKTGFKDLYPYMADPWRLRFERKRAHAGAEARPLKYAHPNGAVVRDDSRPPCGGGGGSDPGFMLTDLLDKNGVDAVILNSLQSGAHASALAGPDESVAICAAFNDYFIDTWLSMDDRFKYAISVPSQDPLQAAAEIRRIGRHSQVVSVSLPLLNILMGNRYYWPIYEAAQEVDLPILVHVTGPDSIFYGTPISAGGIPESYVERYVTLFQAGESSVNSLVFSGTLDRFPRLKFIFVEYGFMWLLPLLWRMDKTWRALRNEVPWVKKSPIEYVHDQMRFTTQPLDEPEDPKDVDKLIGLLGFDQIMFSTDYPHWDNDMPGQVLRGLPMNERKKIFHENALQAFRL